MASNVDLVLRLLAEDRASASFKKVGTEVARTGTTYEKFGKKAAAALAGIGIVAFAKDAIGSASDLSETMSKSAVVFGKSGAAIDKWSDTAATSLGMSKQQAAEAAATFGNLFVSMKLGQGPAADMSTKLVNLASDLASFNNVDPAEALDALRSGLVGETEPLRKFGVNINDATLRQEALKLGLIKTTKDALDPATKAQAAYALILDQTKTAQGDYARTSDGLANSQRTLTAEFEDTKASLGAALLPVMQDTVHVANAALGAFNGLPEPLKTTTVAVTALGAGFVLLVPKIAAAKAAMLELSASKSAGLAAGVSSAGRFTKALSGVAGFLGAAGPWGLAIGAGITALGLFASGSDDATGSQADFKAALEASNGALDENVRKTVAKNANDAGLLEQGRKIGLTEDMVVDAILGDADAREKVSAATREAIAAGSSFVEVGRKRVMPVMTDQAKAADALNKGLLEMTGRLDSDVAAQGRLNNAMRVSAAQAAAVQRSWEHLRVALHKPIDGTVRINVRANGDITVNSSTGGGRGIVPKNAAGGEARAGTTHWVGEYGPELVHFRQPARIVPASASRTASGETVIHTHVHMDSREVATSFVRLKRSNGGTLPFEG